MTSKDFRVQAGQLTFGVRSSALIVNNGKLLTVFSEEKNQYIVPGGAILLGEGSHQAAVREVVEELGVTISSDKLAFIVENHFQQGSQRYHNIEFHYLCQLLEGTPSHMDEPDISGTCKWVEITQLPSINLKPSFLKEELPKWQGQIVHVFQNEIGDDYVNSD